MQIEMQADGKVAIVDGPDRIALDSAQYEDLFFTVPCEPHELLQFLKGSLLQSDGDRVALQRMVDRHKDAKLAMAALQQALEKTPPVSSGTDPELPRPPVDFLTSGQIDLYAHSVFLLVNNDWHTKKIVDALKGTNFKYLGVEHFIEPGLAWVRTNKPDLVILDLATPRAVETTLGGGLSPVRGLVEAHPDCRVVVTFSTQFRSMVGAALRAGARAQLVQPFERVDVLFALKSAITAAKDDKFAAPAAVGKCNLAGTWKARDAGLLDPRQSFLGTQLDMKGVVATVDAQLKTGTLVDLSLQLTGTQKPLECKAEVASAEWSSAKKSGTVRFQFKQLGLAEMDRLSAAVNALKPKRGR